MKNKWKKGILFSFLSLSIITSPLQVFAAGKPLTKSVTIVADSKEYKKEAEKNFQKRLLKTGRVTSWLISPITLSIRNTRRLLPKQ